MTKYYSEIVVKTKKGMKKRFKGCFYQVPEGPNDPKDSLTIENVDGSLTVFPECNIVEWKAMVIKPVVE